METTRGLKGSHLTGDCLFFVREYKYKKYCINF
nr:MAG TPA: hypothetical protein [Caudoviricetes sp.]